MGAGGCKHPGRWRWRSLNKDTRRWRRAWGCAFTVALQQVLHLYGGCDEFGSRPLTILDCIGECRHKSVAPINAQRQRRAGSTIEEAVSDGRAIGTTCAVYLVRVRVRVKVLGLGLGAGVGVGVVAGLMFK